MYIHMYIYIYILFKINIIHSYIYTHYIKHIYIYIYQENIVHITYTYNIDNILYICTHNTYVYVYMYICIYVYMLYVYMYICIYVYIYMYVHVCCRCTERRQQRLARDGKQCDTVSVGNRTNGAKIASFLGVFCYCRPRDFFQKLRVARLLTAKKTAVNVLSFNHFCRSYAAPRFALRKQKPKNAQKPHVPLKHEVDVQICQNAEGPAKIDFGLSVFPNALHGFFVPATCCFKVIARPFERLKHGFDVSKSENPMEPAEPDFGF